MRVESKLQGARRLRLGTAMVLAVCVAVVAGMAVACGSNAPSAAPTAAPPAPTVPPPPPPPTKPAGPTAAPAPTSPPAPTAAPATAASPVPTPVPSMVAASAAASSAPTKPAAPTAGATPASPAASTAAAVAPTAVPAAAAAPAPAAAAPAHLVGADLFQMSCASCHGTNRGGNKFTRKGQTVSVPSLAWNDLSGTYSTQPERGSVEQQVALAITTGQDGEGDDLDPMMPHWSSLAKDQVDSLVALLKTPAPATAPAPALPAAASGMTGQQLFETSCFMCHGKDAQGNNFTRKGQTVSVPNITWGKMGKTYSTDPSRGTPEAQLALAITKGIDQKGADLDAMMPRWSFLAKDQVDSLIQYLKAFP